MTTEIEELLEQALNGIITCPKCGNNLESDAQKCLCGWKNTLYNEGYI